MKKEITKKAHEHGYATDAIIARFAEALDEACKAVKDGAPCAVKISNGNRKMGDVVSVSTLPIITCPACCRETCGVDCYASKIANAYKNVRNAYAHNTAMAFYRPNEYWDGIADAVQGVRFFRFHVSGDITNYDYFAHMVRIAEGAPHCEILAFTKRYSVVNRWIDNNGELPRNLHVLFSEGWGIKAPNPHNLPTTTVIMSGEDPADGWRVCGGNCYNCAVSSGGCWNASKGDVIAFYKH